MPIYVYRCTSCGEVTEVRQKFSDPPFETCHCGGDLHRIPQPTNWIPRCSGFYRTDKVLKDREHETS